MFLPGFVCLSIVGSIVDLRFTEFETAYVGVALSIVIFLTCLLLGRFCSVVLRAICSRRCNTQGSGEIGTLSSRLMIWVMITLVVPVTIGVAWIFAISMQNDWVTSAMRAITPIQILRKFRGNPQYVVFKNHHDCKMSRNDSRPAHIQHKTSGEEIVYPKNHENWIRIIGKNGDTYEGFPVTFQISGEGSQYYLSPACRLDKVPNSRGQDASVMPIPGPGVLVFGKDIYSIEFIDTQDSDCHYMFYQTRKTTPCPE